MLTLDQVVARLPLNEVTGSVEERENHDYGREESAERRAGTVTGVHLRPRDIPETVAEAQQPRDSLQNRFAHSYLLALRLRRIRALVV